MDSREGANDGSRALTIDVSDAWVCVIGEHRWIPAFAGMTEEGVPGGAMRTFIPAFAGMTEQALLPLFPRRRESTDFAEHDAASRRASIVAAEPRGCPRSYPSLPASASSRCPCISHARLNSRSLLSVTLTEISAGSSGV